MTGDRPTKEKRILEQQIASARRSIAAGVTELKENVDDRVEGVKQTIEGVGNFRKNFAREPLVWSIGTLSAGFALGYTLGYAHKQTRRRAAKGGQLAEFADEVLDELSTVGSTLILPRLDASLQKIFDVDLRAMLEDLKRSPARRQRVKKVDPANPGRSRPAATARRRRVRQS